MPVTVAGPHRLGTGFRFRRPQINCRAMLPRRGLLRKRVDERGLETTTIREEVFAPGELVAVCHGVAFAPAQRCICRDTLQECVDSGDLLRES